MKTCRLNPKEYGPSIRRAEKNKLFWSQSPARAMPLLNTKSPALMQSFHETQRRFYRCPLPV